MGDARRKSVSVGVDQTGTGSGSYRSESKVVPMRQSETGRLKIDGDGLTGEKFYFKGKSIEASELESILQDQFNLNRQEQASSQESRGGTMDDGVKMLLERLERDSREREERYHADAKEREERYREEMKEREERNRAESKEREERIIRHFDDGFSTQKQLLETKLDVVDSKLSGMDQNIGHLRNEMSNITARMDAVHGRVDSIKIFIWTSVIAMILGIVGIVYANWQVISAMLQMSSKE